MQEQERSCKQGCSGSLGPYGCRPGPSIGLPAGEDGPEAPRRGGWARGSSQQEKKSWNAGQSPSLIHCGRGEGRNRDRDRGGGQGETKSREDRQERAGAGVSKAALANPSIPPNLSQTPTHRLS